MARLASARSESQTIIRTSRTSSLRPQGLAECSPRFRRFAALRDGLFDVRLKLFVDLAAQTIAGKYIGNASPP